MDPNLPAPPLRYTAQPQQQQQALGHYRFSVASTSTTLFTCSEEDEDEDRPVRAASAAQTRKGSSSRALLRSSSRGSLKGKERAEPELELELELESVEDALVLPTPIRIPLAMDTDQAEGDQACQPVRVRDERASIGHGDAPDEDAPIDEEDWQDPLHVHEDDEDPMDRLIRMSSSLLRVSKSILGNTKRLSVSESAWKRTAAYGEETELQRHLDTLETQDRYLNLMSSDAHAIVHSPQDGGASPSSIGLAPARSSSPLARPLHVPPGRLRPRTSRNSISVASRARTMYIHAEASPSGAGASAVDAYLGAGPPSSSLEMDAEGGPQAPQPARGSELAVHQPAPSARSPTARKPDSRPERALSPSAESNTSSSSTTAPSTFFSSLFSRSTGRASSSTASSSAVRPSAEASPNASSTASTPKAEKRATSSPASGARHGDQSPDAPKDAVDRAYLLTPPHSAPSSAKDAKSLLVALAASASPTPSPTALSPPVPSLATGLPSSSSLSPPLTGSKSRSRPPSAQHGAHASLSPNARTGSISAGPGAGPTTAVSASAQLSAVHSANPHLTLARSSAPPTQNGPQAQGTGRAMNNGGRPRHRASLSETLLKASWSAFGAPAPAASPTAAGTSTSASGSATALAASSSPLASADALAGAPPPRGHRRSRASLASVQLAPPADGSSASSWVSNVPMGGQLRASERIRGRELSAPG